MARRTIAGELSVYAQQRLMGTLKASRDSQLEFRYDPVWLSDVDAFPMSLSMPLMERPYKTETLQPVLDNMLPDEPGVRQAIAARVGARGTDPFSLLWELGRDCVGALQFLPIGEEPDWDVRIEGEELGAEQVADVLSSLSTSPLGIRRDSEFRISLAGAQEKTALLRVGERWIRPVGTTPSSHILKPAIGSRGGVDLSKSVDNEYVCMVLASELGLPTAKVTMEAFGHVKALVVQRFDRDWVDDRLIRLPQEDVCQALSVPSFRKYEADGGPGMADIFELLLQSDQPEADRKQFFQSNFAFWLLGAPDGHGKNFSLALGAQGGFRLTPLYDVVSLQANVDNFEVRRQEFRLALAVGSNRHYRIDEIVPRHFLQSAMKSGISAVVAEEWMWEIAGQVPTALERVRKRVGNSVPDDLLESNGVAAMRRVGMFGGLQ